MGDETRMSDFEDLTARLLAFRDARDWAQFHTAKNLAASISIEAAELLEELQWVEGAAAEREARARADAIAAELADVVVYALLLARHLGIDMRRAILDKIAANEAKYPVARARGSSRKYTEL
jgi:dCTP diphosphatase